MAKQLVVVCDFKNAEKAVLTDKQVSSLDYTSSPELLLGVTYVAPRQFLHVEEKRINGKTVKSVSIFLLAYKEGQLMAIQTCSISALRRMHFGEDDGTAPSIRAVKNSSRWQAEKGTPYFGCWEDGGICFRGAGDQGWVAKDTAFTVTRRALVWESVIEETKQGLQNKHQKVDKAEVLVLSKHRRPVFRQEVSCPNWEEDKDLPKEFREFLVGFRPE